MLRAPQEVVPATQMFFSVVFAEYAQFKLGVVNQAVNYIEQFVPLPPHIHRAAPKLAKAGLVDSCIVDLSTN